MTVEDVIDKFMKSVPELNVHIMSTDEQNLYHGKAEHIVPKIKEFEATRVVLVIEAKPNETNNVVS